MFNFESLLKGDPQDLIKSVALDNSTMQEALKIEKELQPEADKFYKEYIGVNQIKRYDWNDPLQRQWQKNDVDCSIEFYAPTIGLFWVNVSEKFRTWDWGDMCIELYSDFDKKKIGWGLGRKDLIPGPDMYLYITPENYYEVWSNEWFVRMMDEISKELTWDKINSIIDRNSYNKSYKVTVDGVDMTLVQAYTTYPDRQYFGISISIPWDILFEKYCLNITKYTKDGKRQEVVNK